jgi:hypothetical protein
MCGCFGYQVAYFPITLGFACSSSIYLAHEKVARLEDAVSTDTRTVLDTDDVGCWRTMLAALRTIPSEGNKPYHDIDPDQPHYTATLVTLLNEATPTHSLLDPSKFRKAFCRLHIIRTIKG